MQGAEQDRGSLNDYIQALAAALELPDEGAMQRGGQQHMNAQPAGATPQINSNFAPSPHAQSYGSPRRSPHHSQHPSPRAHVQDPFAAATAAAPAQAHSGAHSAGHSGAYSNHSGGAYNSGASGGQPSVGHHQGNYAYDSQGGHGAPGGHYPSDVPANNAAMLRAPLDDVWPAPNQHGISPGQMPRQTSGDGANLQAIARYQGAQAIMQSAFNMGGNGPSYPPRPPFGAQHPMNSQISAPAAGGRRTSLGGGTSNFLPNFGRAPSEGRENNRTASGYSLGGSEGPTYPLSGPHSDSGPHARGQDNQVQSIVNLNTLGLTQTPASWDGNPMGENSGGQGGVAAGYLTPRGVGGSVGRASSAPLAQPMSGGEGQNSSARPKRRRRNEQQQVNNKLAQQRYREKQKVKTRELEVQVEELTAQVKALETSSGRSRELMEENELLRTQHQQLRLKLQAQIKKVAAADPDAMDADGNPVSTADDLNLSDGALNVEGSAAADAQAAIAAAGTVTAAGGDAPGSPPTGDVDMEDRTGDGGDVASSSRGAEMAETARRLEVVTEHIRKLLMEQELPTDTVIPEDDRYRDLILRRELATLIQGHNTSCAKIIIEKGSEASAIMQTDQAAAQELWGRCLVGINLCDQQVTQILDERTKLLARMANLSGVRNHLALHAVGILVPSRHRPSSHPSQEARLQSLETNGAFEVLHGELELQESLDGVAGNLIKGRQVIVEFNQFFITKVLKVEQAAVLLSITHPYHPDCLALANLMAQTRRNVTSGTENRT